MMKSLLLSCAVFFVTLSAFANPEKVAKIDYKNASYQLEAELYFDKVRKNADLWIDLDQGAGANRVTFKATSLASRFSEADIKLVPEPVTKIDGVTSLIYDGFELKSESRGENNAK